ncbi:MAG: hypothetical protein E7122_01550 [Bacteroidales bacterium]|nr:hypothetical protein [Bacteroidales bacterium]
MKKKFQIVVEGVADKQFIRQYVKYLFGEDIPENLLISTEGKDKLKKSSSINRIQSMTDDGGINLVIFDADDDFTIRLNEINEWKKENNLEFELFLFPNNKSSGELEDLLENIINLNNKEIFECWDNYERELKSIDIPGRTPPPLTTPAKKTKIYGYLEALLSGSSKDKEKIKERNRDYTNSLHWNLNADYLEPLKTFLLSNLLT